MLITYGRQSIDSNDAKEVLKALKSDYLTQGPLVNKFEDLLKKKFKTKYTLAVSNGSAALHLIGKILDWKTGDKIIVPPITFVSSVNSIAHCMATPKFVDINLKNYCIDVNKLENILKYDRKVKAVIVTDYAGHPADWEKLLVLKKKYNIKLVNDNCHAIGSSINQNFGYATKFADLVALSFHPVKGITTGEGGAILTNNYKYFLKGKLFRSHGINKEFKNKLKNKPWYYEMKELGFNFRLSDIQSALGISQIRKLNKFIQKRKKIALFYNKIFTDTEKFTIPLVEKNVTHSYHLYPLLVNFKKINKTKEQVFKEFFKKRIKLQVHFIPVNMQPYYKKKVKFDKIKFKNSVEFYKKEISMPIYYDLSFKQLKYIKKVCKKIFNIK